MRATRTVRTVAPLKAPKKVAMALSEGPMSCNRIVTRDPWQASCGRLAAILVEDNRGVHPTCTACLKVLCQDVRAYEVAYQDLLAAQSKVEVA